MREKLVKTVRSGMIIILSAILFLQGLPVQTAYAAEENLPSGIACGELEAEIEKYVEEHEDTTAGMALSVFNQYEAIYTDYFGYADKEAGLTVNKDTVMEWGSASKLLVWVSVMQLMEQGKIDLDTDIKEYLPKELVTNLSYDTPVTMINLMNHTAGYQEVYADLFVKRQDAVRPFEEALKAHMPEQIYEPGSVTAYSNWGVALAAYIVERISNQSFDNYVHQHIFEPLGMEHSALAADLSDNGFVAEKRKELQCYTTDGTLIPDCFYYINLYPAGMCTSTLEDFGKFGMALLDENSPLFKKSETWETLFTPTAYLGDSGLKSNCHGFWVLPYGVETYGHGGNTAGCSSYLLLDIKNKIGAVVMTNQSGETVYNCDMMELIFGKYSAQNYFDGNQGSPEGIYSTARTVRRGPFKVLSLSYTDAADLEEVWAVGTGGGIDKVCCLYADYVRVPLWRFILEMILFFSWIAALVFSLVSIFVKMIRKLIYILKKKNAIIPLNGFSSWAAVLQLTAAALLAVILSGAAGFELSASYVWASVALGVIAAAMAAFIIWGVYRIRKSESGRLRKFYNYITIVMLAVTAANILYWNLFMFWKI